MYSLQKSVSLEDNKICTKWVRIEQLNMLKSIGKQLKGTASGGKLIPKEKGRRFYKHHVPKVLFSLQEYHNSNDILFLEMNLGKLSTNGFKWDCKN